MRAVELVLILLAVAAALHLLAERSGIPRPALLVLGGLLLAVTPGLPVVELPPEVVFLIFVPPLIYVAAFDTSYRPAIMPTGEVVEWGFREDFFGQCWTFHKASDAMWRIYSPGGNGIVPEARGYAFVPPRKRYFAPLR